MDQLSRFDSRFCPGGHDWLAAGLFESDRILIGPFGGVVLWGIMIPHYFLVLGSIYGQFEQHYVHESQGEIQSFLKDLDKISELNEAQKQTVREELTKHLEKPSTEEPPSEEENPPTNERP
jgi:hypothetical protein